MNVDKLRKIDCSFYVLCSMFGNKSFDPRVAHQIKGRSCLNAVNLNHFYSADKYVQSCVMKAAGVIVRWPLVRNGILFFVFVVIS